MSENDQVEGLAIHWYKAEMVQTPGVITNRYFPELDDAGAIKEAKRDPLVVRLCRNDGDVEGEVLFVRQ